MPRVRKPFWVLDGEIDAYGDKTWATFLIPALMTLMLGLLRVLPWLSPKHFEMDAFRGTYEFVVLLVVGLFGYINALLLFAASGGPVNFGRAMIGGMCLFFLLLGNVLGKVRKNFFVGVRTPWTLASDRVWADTHRLAARLFVAAGVIGLPFCVWGGTVTSFAAPFAMIMLACLAPAVYSLWHYKRLERSGEL